MPCLFQNIPECIDRERLSIEVPFLGSTLLIESNDFIKMRWDFDQLAQAALFIDKEKAATLIDEYEESARQAEEFARYRAANTSPVFSLIPPSYSGPKLAKLVFEKLKGFEFSDKGRNFVFSKCDFVNEMALFYFEPIQFRKLNIHSNAIHNLS